MSFSENLDVGKVAEGAISMWLQSRGHCVLPIYEVAKGNYKGPQLYTGGEGLIAPDMLAMKGGKVLWIESKHKTGFTFWRIGQVFETGIDLRHYRDYIEIRRETMFPVWLLFLHKGGQVKDSPESPPGLYGNDIDVLRANESHRDDRHGRSGMVYWTRECDGGALRYIADYDEVTQFTHNGNRNMKAGKQP